MSDSLELAAPEVEHTVQTCTQGGTGGEVLAYTEVLKQTGTGCLHLVRLWIVVLTLGAEIPVHAIGDRRSQSDIL